MRSRRQVNMSTCIMYMCLYYTRDRNSYFDQKTKTAPVAGRRCEHVEAAPAESGEASKVRHDEQTVHGTTSKQYTGSFHSVSISS